DLHRFLVGEPIQARPVSVFEKGWKWAKRQPAVATAVGLAVLLLVGIVGGSVVFAQQQSQRAAVEAGLRQEADRQTIIAQQNERKANEQKELTAKQYARADKNLDHARKAVNDFLVKVAGGGLERYPRTEQLRIDLLQLPLGFFQEFLNDANTTDEAKVRYEAGWAHLEIGRVRDQTGNPDLAIASYGDAVKVFERLAREHPSDRGYRTDLATTYKLLSLKLEAAGRRDEADQTYDEARKLFMTLADEFP